MGIVSIEASGRLFWLGRYVERALLVSRAIVDQYDKSLDLDEEAYKTYLTRMGLEDTFGGSQAFARGMLLDRENTASAHYSLERAFDNAIVLREEIGSQAFSFIQMALDTVAEAARSGATVTAAGKQQVEDKLLGFIGAVHEDTRDLDARSIISLGRALERLDLALRLQLPYEHVVWVFRYFCHIVDTFPQNTPYRCNREAMARLAALETLGEDYTAALPSLLDALNGLFLY